MRARTSSFFVSQKSASNSRSSSGVSRSDEKMVVGVTADISSVSGRLRRRVFVAISFPTSKDQRQHEGKKSPPSFRSWSTGRDHFLARFLFPRLDGFIANQPSRGQSGRSR